MSTQQAFLDGTWGPHAPGNQRTPVQTPAPLLSSYGTASECLKRLCVFHVSAMRIPTPGIGHRSGSPGNRWCSRAGAINGESKGDIREAAPGSMADVTRAQEGGPSDRPGERLRKGSQLPIRPSTGKSASQLISHCSLAGKSSCCSFPVLVTPAATPLLCEELLRL